MRTFKITRGATVNIGNYESARVDLEVSGDAEDFDEADNFVKKWLHEKVAAIQDAAGVPPHPVERFTGGEE